MPLGSGGFKLLCHWFDVVWVRTWFKPLDLPKMGVQIIQPPILYLGLMGFKKLVQPQILGYQVIKLISILRNCTNTMIRMKTWKVKYYARVHLKFVTLNKNVSLCVKKILAFGCIYWSFSFGFFKNKILPWILLLL